MHTASTDISNNLNLSKREIEVINLVAHEYSTKEIARKLYVSFETIKTHRKNIFNKLQVKNVAGLVRVACTHRLVSIQNN